LPGKGLLWRRRGLRSVSQNPGSTNCGFQAIGRGGNLRVLQKEGPRKEVTSRETASVRHWDCDGEKRLRSEDAERRRLTFRFLRTAGGGCENVESL